MDCFNFVYSQNYSLDSLDFSVYSEHFNSLLYIEQCQMEVDIAQYTMFNTTMRKDSRSKGGLLKLQVYHPAISYPDKRHLVFDWLYNV